MYASYDDPEIGPLDGAEVEGDFDLDSEMMQKCLEDFQKAKAEDVITTLQILLSTRI